MGQQIACLDFCVENNVVDKKESMAKQEAQTQQNQQNNAHKVEVNTEITAGDEEDNESNPTPEPHIQPKQPQNVQKVEANTDMKVADDWDDDNWNDDDNIGDIISMNTKNDAQDITRTDSLPPVLGAHISYNKLILNDSEDEPHAELTQYTICKNSDRPKSFISPDKDYGGLVLYQYDGETEWKLNGIDCKIGLILIKDSANLSKSSVGQIHGGLYKTFFNESVNEKIVASGFAYYNNKWVFKSRAFNLKTNEHIMRDSEVEWLKKALENWCAHGIETTKVSPSLNVYWQEKGPYIPK